MAKLFLANSRWLIALVLTLVSLVTSSCEFRTPAPVTPQINTNGELIRKAFFFKNREFKPGTCSDQTFMATWAPIDERGIYAEYFLLNGVPKKMHLNVFWCFTQDALIGYEVNPSFPNQRNHARAVIEIPITKNYYYEPKKDGYQRDTNEMIKNDGKDAFMHTPFMDLDFKGITVNDWSYSIVWKSPKVLDVAAIEWDEANQFLAFTVEAKDSWLPERAQTRFRFNFKAFNSKSEEEFKPTPYDATLSRHINVLHVIGRTLNGVDTQAFAGRWDVKKKPVTFYTYGVPDDQMDIVEDVVDAWNDAFVQAGVVPAGQRALLLNKTPLKYPVDLRYPVINWVSDKRESLYSPLGIGIASADVQNGEFLYGSVTVWAGYLEEMMNRFAVAETSAYAALATAERIGNLDRRTFFDIEQLKKSSTLFGDPEGGIKAYLESDEAYSKLAEGLKLLEQRSNHIESTALENATGLSDEMKAEYGLAMTEQMKAEFAKASQFMFTKATYLENLRGSSRVGPGDMPSEITGEQYYDMLYVFNEHFSSTLFDAPESKDPSMSVMTDDQAMRIAEQAVRAQIVDRLNPAVQDMDHTFAEVIPDLIAGMRASGRSEREVLRATVKFLLLHELGHVLGLGHNFKGNILPEKGTIADSQYAAIKGQLEKTGWVATSVMDYYNGRTEAQMDYDDVTVGPYDVDMLRYLYNGQYPAIADGGQTLKYFDVPKNGVVPYTTKDDSGKEYKVAFLPACNDIEASTNVHPLCMRFDRGHNATEIMVNRFKDFNSSLMSMLNAFSSAKGGNVYSRIGMLWYRTLNEFSQIRVFYDYMRLLLDNEDGPYKAAYDVIRNDQEALLAFADACRDPNLAPNQKLKEAFAELSLKDPSKLGTPVDDLKAEDFTEVRDLCVANKYALDQWAELMKRDGSDYPTYDRMNRYVPGGLRGGDLYLDWGYIWGAYREVGAFPLRLSTLYMVTSPVPYFIWGGLYGVPLYDNPQGRYSYAPLYPREFGKVIDTTVKENLNLGGGVLQEKTEIGSTLMYLNYLMMRNRFWSKDNDTRFPAIYLENLNSLTKFDIQFSPIILSNVTKEGKRDTLVFNYAATYLDISNRDAVAIPFAYLMTDRRVIAQGNAKQIFLPITKFRYLTDRWGYAWAIDLRYYFKEDDPLKGYSVTYGLDRLAQTQIENCAQGSNGLSSFFNVTNETFEGFEVGTGIATKPDLQRRFDDSVKRAYATYYASPLKPGKAACDDALRNLNVIVGGGAMINGYWLPSAIKYLNF